MKAVKTILPAMCLAMLGLGMIGCHHHKDHDDYDHRVHHGDWDHHDHGDHDWDHDHDHDHDHD